MVEQLGRKGAGFRSLAEPWADTTSSAGKFVLTTMAGVAQFERERIKERQREGIAQAKREGRYTGGKVQFDHALILKMLAEGKGPSQVAKELGCGEATVFRGRPR